MTYFEAGQDDSIVIDRVFACPDKANSYVQEYNNINKNKRKLSMSSSLGVEEFDFVE